MGNIGSPNGETVLGDFIPTSYHNDLGTPIETQPFDFDEVGIEPKFVRGLRVTDADTMEARLARFVVAVM